MEESSRFLSLSGLSGIFAGIFALAGALIAWYFILGSGTIPYNELFGNLPSKEVSAMKMQLIIDAVLVLFLSVIFSVYYSARKAKRAGKNIWSPVSKRLLVNMLIPLAAGGLFIIILMVRNNMHLIIPGLLIFYGLALVNAEKFTSSEVFYLGLLEILTG